MRLPNLYRHLWQAAILSALCSVMVSLPAYAVNIDKIIVFGDSLSDNHNVYDATVTAHKKTDSIPVIPASPPYYNGHFSNGPVWVENLANLMHLNVNKIKQFSDYAYGGACAEDWDEAEKVCALSPPLSAQISMYTVAYFFDNATDKHLFVIWAGGNDYLEGRKNIDDATTKATKRIKLQIDKLLRHGAKNFLVLNLPDLGQTPSAKEKGADFSQQLTELSKVHNKKLADIIEEEKQVNKDVKFVSVDVMSYFNDIAANPQKYNLKNITDACYGGRYSVPSFFKQPIENTMIAENISLTQAYLTARLAENGVQPCINQDEYLYWDHVHPTKVIHQLLANLVLDVLKQNDVTGPINSEF